MLGEPAGSPGLRRRVAYVTQTPSVYLDLTAAQNLTFYARILDSSADDVARAMQAVDLEAHARQLTGRLSGGQRTRVSVAAALLGDPELLVLDEPTVGLDPLLREELWSTFGELAAEGRTLLVSSHVMDEADRCDELLLMREGRILAHDSPAVLRRYTGTESMSDAFLRLVREAQPG